MHCRSASLFHRWANCFRSLKPTTSTITATQPPRCTLFRADLATAIQARLQTTLFDLPAEGTVSLNDLDDHAIPFVGSNVHHTLLRQLQATGQNRSLQE